MVLMVRLYESISRSETSKKYLITTYPTQYKEVNSRTIAECDQFLKANQCSKVHNAYFIANFWISYIS